MTLIGLAVDTVPADDSAEETYREEDLGEELRTEWMESGLKLFFTKIVPPKAVIRLRIDILANANPKVTASLVNKTQTVEVTFGPVNDLSKAATMTANVGK